jgi:flagellar biosynthetic protein FliQ
MVALPAVAVAALAGTAVAIVQAATQIQEQTLSFLPKLLAVGVVLVLGGPCAMSVLARLFRDALAALPSLVSGT